MKTILFLLWISYTSAFCRNNRLHFRNITPSPSQLHLTTEEDVIKLVEKAELLWDKAYEARKAAKELSEQAETLGVSAEQSATDANEMLQSSISIAKIGDAQIAQNLSLDLGNLLDRIEEAEKKANEIEIEAEKALKESEKALEQHLIDFPENA